MPRSWTSGAYFQKFREFLFNNMVIEHVHLFESRDKVFDKESVLQKFRRSERHEQEHNENIQRSCKEEYLQCGQRNVDYKERHV